MDIKQYIKCKNIDPQIREYIGFGDDEFKSFSQAVQDRFLNKATERYIKELEENKENIYGNIIFCDGGTSSTFGSFYDSVPTVPLATNRVEIALFIMMLLISTWIGIRRHIK